MSTQTTESFTAPTVATAASGDAVLLHRGRRHPLGGDGVTIGRAEDVDIVLAAAQASREHARVEPAGDGYRLVDLGSKNGTFLNGERISRPAALASGDTIAVGGEQVRFVWGRATAVAGRHLPVVGTQLLQLSGERLTIGRDPANDLVLDDPNVSRFHAEARIAAGEVELRDLRSTNGTFVDGRPLRAPQPVAAGTDVRVGPYRLIFDRDSVVARDERRDLRVEAHGVGVRAGGKQILAPISLSLEPGRFVAVIGESGAGKSTLVKALAAVQAPSEGAVTINGDDVALHRTSIGYVPQGEIVHERLTVGEALRYAARLRLPEDTTADEVRAVCAGVLDELALTEHAATRIDRLSGGQRRRVGVALELLSRPGLLFLDEPTTGLDPGLETRMMRLLRELADGSRSVIIVTHATANLALCDDVLVIGRGGHLCFKGAPEEALAFFGVERYDDIYLALEDRPAAEWAQRFQGGRPPEPDTETAAPVPAGAGAKRRPPHGPSLGHQFGVLASRYLRVFQRDRRNVLILLGQVPLIALALFALFDAGVFSGDRHADDAAQLVFMLVTVMIWLGAIDSAREIIKERGILARETAAGLRLDAYVLSKVAVLGGLVAVQLAVFAGIVLATRPLHETPARYAALVGALLLTALVAVGLGLLISAIARSQDQATSFVPLLLIPQLFFAGAIIPVPKMSEATARISDFVFARWSYGVSGAAADLHTRLLERYGGRSVYGSFFDDSMLHGFLVLGAFAVAAYVLVYALLQRRAG